MLRLCLQILLFSFVFAKDIEKWPFMLADKYIEEFKALNEELETSATEFERREENLLIEKEHIGTEIVHDDVIYDFIIIGGGTSGSVLASRLSEIPEWKVLLLEAGDSETIATRVPKNWELLKNTHYNWGFKTTSQNHSCLGMKDHKCTIPLGRAVGGSSAINSMVYTRGNPRDYDLWSDLGNEGWCWGDVLPVFKKIEDAYFEPFDKKYHHRGGPQHIEHPQHLTFLADHVLEAAKDLHIPSIDYNGKHQTGGSIPQLISECGRRYSAASAYLDHTEKRNNLIVKPLSQVLKILISTHTKEARGVEYLHKGKIFIAKAEKEVILAAGAINTPKILMLSGIGTKEECERHKINIVSELKVGHNLKIRPSFIALDYFYHDDHHHEDINHYQEMLQYLKHGKGFLTSPGIEALIFLQTNLSKHFENYPDIELQFWTKLHHNHQQLEWLKLSKEHYDSVYKHLEGIKSVKITVTLTHPKSKGIIKLNPHNPLLEPIIEPHFLSDEEEIDFHTLLEGIHEAIKLTHTKPFLKLGLKINHHNIHGCENYEFGSDLYWKCAIKYLTVATEDVSGTARMGPSHDHDAVVDKKLMVHGVHNLRVADASVIPVSITGNLMAAKLMIGEKAAHFIIQDWQKHSI